MPTPTARFSSRYLLQRSIEETVEGRVETPSVANARFTDVNTVSPTPDSCRPVHLQAHTLCATPLHPYLGKAKVSDPLETQSPAADHPPSRGPFPNFPLPHQRFRNQKTTSSPLRLLSAAERCLRLTTPVDASQHSLPHSPVIKRRFIRFCICPGRDAFTFPTGSGALP